MERNSLLICVLSIYMLSSLSMHADPVFHLKNKSHDTIQISIKQGNASFGELISIAKGKGYGQTLNTSLPTTLELYYCPTKDFCKTNLPEKLIADFPANTKIYIKFEGKTISPQQGNKLTNKTTEGYSLEGNVTSVSVKKGKADRSALGTGSGHQQEPQKTSASKPTPQAQPTSQSSAAQTAYQPAQIGWTAQQTAQQVPPQKPAMPSAKPTQPTQPQKPTMPTRPAQPQQQTPTSQSSAAQTAYQPAQIGWTAQQTAQQVPPQKPAMPSAKPTQPTQPQKPTMPTRPAQPQQQTQDPVEQAWNEFSAANSFRQSTIPPISLEKPRQNRKATDAPELARKVLGVTNTASATEIKKTYHKLSLKYHPDSGSALNRLPTATLDEAFIIITNARNILLGQPSETYAAEPSNKQEIITLFDEYPKGHKGFADPIYEQLSREYNKQTLMDAQEKVKENTTLPGVWKRKVLSLIGAELKNM